MTLCSLKTNAARLDEADPLRGLRNRFKLSDDTVYLDGNSLGPMLNSVPERISNTLESEWASGLIRSWNDAGWIDLPERVGAKIAPLIGAHGRNVAVTDSTSVNLFKLLGVALQLNGAQKIIVSEQGNFPTDLYLVDGISNFLDRGHQLHLAEGEEQFLSLITEDVAVVLLTHVNFRTGRMLDMDQITKVAHEKGALVIWDLAHSAGIVPVHLDAVQADFAVGCGYKFLNGGPGAPSFLYVNERHIGKVQQPLSGWFSHKAPFAFDQTYEPSQSIKQFLCGTPPILSMVALDEALRIWEDVSIDAVRAKSLALTDFFLDCLEAAGLAEHFIPATPFEHKRRGGQVSLEFAGDGYAIIQALISRGVIGDYRAPNILRFGFAPLYNTFSEVYRAVESFYAIFETGAWKQSEFAERKAVT